MSGGGRTGEARPRGESGDQVRHDQSSAFESKIPASAPEELGDQEFIQALETCRIGAGDFRHRDHVRLAWVLLGQMPLLRVLARVSADLRRFAAHHGVSHIYNETLTWVYVMVIHQRMLADMPVTIDLPGGATRAAHSTGDFDEFCACNPDLFLPVDQFMAGLYQPESWKSAAAKSTFLLPDYQARD